MSRNGDSGSIKIDVNITHTYKGDLDVDLIAPDGSTWNVHSNTGGSANNVIGTYTADATGVSANGEWRLRARDNASRDVGTINSWAIEFQ